MKILFITDSVSSLNSGGSIYSYGILYRLCENAQIDLVTFLYRSDPQFYQYIDMLNLNAYYITNMQYLDKLVKYFIYQSTFLRYSNKMIRLVQKLLNKNEYEVIIIDHLRMGFLINIIKNSRAKIVYVEHNVESDNYYEQIKLKSYFFERFKNIGLPRFEKKFLKNVDQCLCITENDRKVLNKRYGIAIDKLKIVKPFFPYQRLKYDYTPNKQIVITGTMDWYPNVEGVIWFCKKVFTKIVQADNEYKLYVVGRNPTKEILRLANENIIVTGEVVSVDEYLCRSDMLVVPNKQGGGAKIKIMEAALKGVPVIAVRECVSGYEDCFLDQFVVDVDSEFAMKILEINNNCQIKELFVRNFISKISVNTQIEI